MICPCEFCEFFFLEPYGLFWIGLHGNLVQTLNSFGDSQTNSSGTILKFVPIVALLSSHITVVMTAGFYVIN